MWIMLHTNALAIKLITQTHTHTGFPHHLQSVKLIRCQTLASSSLVVGSEARGSIQKLLWFLYTGFLVCSWLPLVIFCFPAELCEVCVWPFGRNKTAFLPITTPELAVCVCVCGCISRPKIMLILKPSGSCFMASFPLFYRRTNVQFFVNVVWKVKV